MRRLSSFCDCLAAGLIASAFVPAIAAQADSFDVKRCVNMGNALESPSEGEWGHTIAADLNVIVNVHHFDPLYEDPETHGPNLVKTWAQISQLFSGYPDNLQFELINEPTKNFKDTIMRQTMRAAFMEVRKTHPTRMIIMWERYKIRGVADRDYDNAELAYTFHLGSAKQTVCFGPIFALNLGQ